MCNKIGVPIPYLFYKKLFRFIMISKLESLNVLSCDKLVCIVTALKVKINVDDKAALNCFDDL